MKIRNKIFWEKIKKPYKTYKLFLNTLPFHAHDYENKKGPGTNYDSHFQLQNMFRKTPFSTIYHPANFNVLIKSKKCDPLNLRYAERLQKFEYLESKKSLLNGVNKRHCSRHLKGSPKKRKRRENKGVTFWSIAKHTFGTTSGRIFWPNFKFLYASENKNLHTD